MCGICGIVERAPSPAAERFIDDALRAHEHRGPDFRMAREARLGELRCTFGHNRLSIIDLSSGANQPMPDEASATLLTYNGEIYNYRELRDELAAQGERFATVSDTEVILAAYRAWGIACVERFNGMFAFAILDRAAGRLHLVRDRFGVKPLYFHESPERVLFASTAGPIARAVGAAPHLAYALGGLTTRVYERDDEDASPYERVHAVRAGHVYSVALDRPALSIDRRAYYDLHARVATTQETLAGLGTPALVERLRAELQRAVEVRLRSDVPVGVSLSGGLDSGTVAALASAAHPRIVTFSHAHPDFPTTEAPAIEALRRKVAIDAHYVWPEPAEVADAFWRCLEAQDAPFPTTSIVAQYLVYQAARKHGIKVLLGGQGGDEAFMGYRKYQVFQLRESLRRGRLPSAAAQAMQLARIAATEAGNVAGLLSSARRYTGTAAESGIFRPQETPRVSLGHPAGAPLWHRQVADIYSTSLPTLLRYEDRNSMGNSIESRLPFMDYRVMELGLALPESLKLRKGYGKWLVREMTRDMLPPEVRVAFAKRGFDAASTRWFGAGLGARMRERLHAYEPTLRPLLRGPVTDDYFSDQRLAQQPAVFAEAVTALWLGGALTHS